MSVNIYDGTNLTPIAGKTVPAPTPDYVDAQYDSNHYYVKGETCINGNVRYRYKSSTSTKGNMPPNTTYWEVLSVSDEINEYKEGEMLIGSFLGKPLYRYVWKINQQIPQSDASPNYVQITIPLTFAQIGYITKLTGVLYFYKSADGYTIMTTTEGGGGQLYIDNNGKITMRLYIGTSATCYCKAVIFEYTKEKWT